LWYLSAAFVYFKDEVFGIDILVDIHFVEFNAAVHQKFLGAPAIDAPAGAIHGDFFHMLFDVIASGSDAVLA